MRTGEKVVIEADHQRAPRINFEHNIEEDDIKTWHFIFLSILYQEMREQKKKEMKHRRTLGPQECILQAAFEAQKALRKNKKNSLYLHLPQPSHDTLSFRPPQVEINAFL